MSAAQADQMREVLLAQVRSLSADGRTALDRGTVSSVIHARPSPYAIPCLLAFIGLGVLLISTGGAFWPFALAWLAAITVVITLKKILASSRFARVALAGVVVMACPILTFEGGLFVLPAALALFVIEARGGQKTGTVRFARW